MDCLERSSGGRWENLVWTSGLVQRMYANERSHVAERFQWRVWSEGLCSPRLLTLPAALHHCAWNFVTRFHSGVLLEDLYADDLVVIAESLKECVRRLSAQKEAMEEKGPSKHRKDEDDDLWYWSGPLQSSGEFPSAICRTGVGSSSIFCNSCKHWVHKKYCWLKRLAKDTNIRCTGNCMPLGWQTTEESPSRIWQAVGDSFL